MLLSSPYGYWILQWVVSAIALMITAYFLPGFQVSSFFAALFTAVIIGLANVTIRPVLLILTLPLNILTLGLFTFIVDGIVLRICAAFTPGFSIKNWGSAFLGAVILAIVNTALHFLLV
jgi:putative membrane protein